MTDSNSGLPLHGGDLDRARRDYPRAPAPWVDLSTGINPWPYPHDGVAVDWTRLPSPSALASLLEAARDYYRIPQGRDIAAVAGLELAIRLLPHCLDGNGCVEIVGPTYATHEASWHGARRDVRVVETINPDSAVAVIVSPNNPDGRTASADALTRLAQRLAEHGGVLIVDRSFADVSDAPDALPPADNLIELRSFGKFFGLAGLRLGFVIANARTVAAIDALTGAWPLNAAALALGERALRDTAWQVATRATLRRAAETFRATLASHVDIAGGTDLFCLARTPNAAMLHRHLCRRGILTRVFDVAPEWIRFGLPPDDAATTRLAEALAAFHRRAA